MKFWRGLAVVATAVAVAGCAAQRDQAQGGFDYLELDESQVLLVPEGMVPVVQHPDFAIPQLDSYSGPVGPRQSIRAPRQVMPLVPGSRIEEGSRQARIWFDAVEDMSQVADWVWEELVAMVEEQDIPVESMQEREYIRTGTIREDEGSRARGGFWSALRRDRIEFSSEYSLQINMQAPGHGRSAMLEVDASDMRWFEDDSEVETPPHLRRALEAGFLNDLSIRMQRNFERQRVASVRATRTLRHAESPQGEPAYALDTDFDSGWVMMPGVFDYLGFEVEDLSQRDGIYYVDYQPGGSPGFFRRMAFWRSEDRGMLDLPRGDGYEFEVDESNGVFYIVIRHNGEILDEEELDRMFPIFAEAFSEHSD